MEDRRNPFDWQSHHPRVAVARGEVDRIAGNLAKGGNVVGLGGRGMGKSVFLQQLRAALEQSGEVRVVLISTPPPELTVRACLDRLAGILEVTGEAVDTRMIVDAWFARDSVKPRLVLLFDEFDRYASFPHPTSSANPPGRGFFNDLEATRRDVSALGIMATGSLGVFVARDVFSVGRSNGKA